MSNNQTQTNNQKEQQELKKQKTLGTQKTLKSLRTLETICIGGAMVGFVGFLSGAMINNEKLALISGGAALLSAGIAYYANTKQDKYNKYNKYNSQNDSQYDEKSNKYDLQ